MKQPKTSAFDSNEFRLWADERRRKMIPQMRGSDHVLMLAPDLSIDFDVEFALQVGAAIMLEKPLILVVHAGRNIPPKLRAIADKIIETDLDATTMDMLGVQEQIRQAMKDLERQ